MTRAAAPDVSGVPAFPPIRAHNFDIPEMYADARAIPGLFTVHMTWLDRDVSLVSRYADVQTVLTSDRSTVDFKRSDFPVMEEYRAYNPKNPSVPILHMEAPRHNELRRIITPALTVKRVKEMEPAISAIVDHAIDDMVAAGDEGELQSQLTFRVHGGVVTVLFGMPAADGDKLTALALRQLQAAHDGRFDVSAATEVVHHIVRHLESVTSPTPLVASLLAARERGDIDQSEMISLATTVYVGGFETTASALGASLFELLRRPEAAAYFRDADEAGTVTALNELLRYTSVDHFGLGRMSTGDIPLADGTVIAPDERLAVSLFSANRDPSQFTDPEELDLTREDNPHLTFGFGPYQCPGQQLARAEVRTVLKRLLTRLPGVRLAQAPEQVVFNERSELRGPLALPVTW